MSARSTSCQRSGEIGYFVGLGVGTGTGSGNSEAAGGGGAETVD